MRAVILAGTSFSVAACSKSNEVAHTTPAQNAAMSNLDVIATAHPKKPVDGQRPVPVGQAK